MKQSREYWLNNALRRPAEDAVIFNYSNGNGVYYMWNGELERGSLVLVHTNGFLTDWLIVYDDHRFAGDSYHYTKTDRQAINRLIKRYWSL